MAFLSSFCSLFDCVNLDKQCLERHWHAQCLIEANHTKKGHEVMLGDEEEMEENLQWTAALLKTNTPNL